MIRTITKSSSVVAVYKSHVDAGFAVGELQESGFDMDKLSIVGRDYHTDGDVVGYYNAGDRMKYWGKIGAFWGGFWGLLSCAELFWVPMVGLLVVAGPLAASIREALNNASVVGGLSAFEIGLVTLGIPKDSIVNYERSIKNENFVVILQDAAGDDANIRNVIESCESQTFEFHKPNYSM